MNALPRLFLAAVVALMIAPRIGAAPLARELGNPLSSEAPALNLSLAQHGQRAPAVPLEVANCKICAQRPSNLSASIAASAKVGLIEQGVATAKEALLECQKGDYPSGGMGLLSMPFGRPSAFTDHCRR